MSQLEVVHLGSSTHAVSPSLLDGILDDTFGFVIGSPVHDLWTASPQVTQSSQDPVDHCGSSGWCFAVPCVCSPAMLVLARRRWCCSEEWCEVRTSSEYADAIARRASLTE